MVMDMKISKSLAGAALVGVLFHAAPSFAGGPSTITTLTASVNPVAVSQSTTFKATVTAPSGGVCTGSVNIAVGPTPLCSATISPDGAAFAGSCSLNGGQIGSPGVYPVSADYESTSSCISSSSSAVSVVVTADPTPVPTMGEWTLWGLMGLIMMAGAAVLVRRTRRLS
jgi:hypothetical protein